MNGSWNHKEPVPQEANKSYRVFLIFLQVLFSFLFLFLFLFHVHIDLRARGIMTSDRSHLKARRASAPDAPCWMPQVAGSVLLTLPRSVLGSEPTLIPRFTHKVSRAVICMLQVRSGLPRVPGHRDHLCGSFKGFPSRELSLMLRLIGFVDRFLRCRGACCCCVAWSVALLASAVLSLVVCRLPVACHLTWNFLLLSSFCCCVLSLSPGSVCCSLYLFPRCRQVCCVVAALVVVNSIPSLLLLFRRSARACCHRSCWCCSGLPVSSAE